MRNFLWFVLGFAMAVLLVQCMGCASFSQMADGCAPGFTLLPCKAESWDQENLKRHDKGCPTAIYANNAEGVLEQC